MPVDYFWMLSRTLTNISSYHFYAHVKFQDLLRSNVSSIPLNAKYEVNKIKDIMVITGEMFDYISSTIHDDGVMENYLLLSAHLISGLEKGFLEQKC